MYVLAAFVVVQGFCRAAGVADRLEEERRRELERHGAPARARLPRR